MGSIIGGSSPVTWSGDLVEKPLAEAAAKEAEATSLETRVKKEDEEGRRRRTGRASTMLSTLSPGGAPSGARSRTTLGI